MTPYYHRRTQPHTSLGGAAHAEAPALYAMQANRARRPGRPHRAGAPEDHGESRRYLLNHPATHHRRSGVIRRSRTMGDRPAHQGTRPTAPPATAAGGPHHLRRPTGQLPAGRAHQRRAGTRRPPTRRTTRHTTAWEPLSRSTTRSSSAAPSTTPGCRSTSLVGPPARRRRESRRAGSPTTRSLRTGRSPPPSRAMGSGAASQLP